MNNIRYDMKKYFYGPLWTKLCLLLAFPVFVFGCILSFKSNAGGPGMLTIFGIFFWIMIGMFVAGAVGQYLWKQPNPQMEALYDQYLKEDIEKFLAQGFDRLGVDDESTSLIEPIKVSGAYLEYEPVPTTKKLISEILDPSIRLIMRAGSDDEVRTNLIQVTMYYFTEEQILCYQVNYDICYGTFFGDATAEYFYRDIDCVQTGEMSRTIVSGKKLIEKRLEYFSVVVGSGTYTKAVSDIRAHILDTQVKGMRNLIRSKKEELR